MGSCNWSTLGDVLTFGLTICLIATLVFQPLFYFSIFYLDIKKFDPAKSKLSKFVTWLFDFTLFYSCLLLCFNLLPTSSDLPGFNEAMAERSIFFYLDIPTNLAIVFVLTIIKQTWSYVK